jgi:ABC-2 type transport system permease protein
MNARQRIGLVARREWSQRVKTVTFRVSTVITALLVVALIALPQILGAGEEATRTVGLVGDGDPALPTLLEQAGDRLGLTVETEAFTDEAAAEAALRADDVEVVLVGEDRLVWKTDPDEALAAVVVSSVEVLRRQEAIDAIGLTPEEVEQLLQPPELSSTSLDPVSDEQQARRDLAWITVIILFMAIAFYCGFVLMGVVEEKSTRVVEVLLSRITATELLAGKVLGIGLVGLAQFAVVVVAALVAYAVTSDTVAPQTTPTALLWMLFWFVLAYAFYSVLYATAGSLVSRQEDTQTISFPVTAVALVAYFFALGAVESPDSTAALLGSLFPPTAPMVMMIRIADGGVPWWQIALSVALMAASIYGLVHLAGRIYAGGLLRFGGRMKLRDAWRAAEV